MLEKSIENHIPSILSRKLEERKNRNISYSMRSFARDLSVDSGTLSQIMSGSRKISEALANKIYKNLSLDESDKETFFRFYNLQRQLDQKINYTSYESTEISKAHTWIVFIILNLIDVSALQISEEKIANDLEIDESVVNEILLKLIKKGIVVRDSKGRLLRGVYNLETPDNVSNEFLRESHLKNLSIAKSRIKDTHLDQRDFSSMTLKFEESRMDEARNLIRKFQDDFCKIFETSSADSVYKLNIQLFSPFTKDKK
jgi:uncharacterized protein (TIGR02147 family)